jgi:hypothetical protein
LAYFQTVRLERAGLTSAGTWVLTVDLWPHRAVRDEIERLASEEIERGEIIVVSGLAHELILDQGGFSGHKG